MNATFSPPRRRPRGFTIVELLAATAVFIGLMLLLVTATNQTGDMWRRSSAKIEQFQQARRGFESMTRRLSQATLNTYFDYDYDTTEEGKPDRSKPPKGYKRQSELRFRSGQAATLIGSDAQILRPTHAVFFQAPLGFVDDDAGTGNAKANHKPLNNLLNTWGYFLEVNDDSKLVPQFIKGTLPERVRSRLVEVMEPSEYLHMDNPSTDKDGNIFDKNYDDPRFLNWFRAPVTQGTHVRVLSENILALVILPRLTQQDELARAKLGKKGTLSPRYDYCSKRISNTAEAIANPSSASTNSDPDADLNPKNQLPPVITVSMVAIDEVSAQRMIALSGADRTFGLEIDQLFLDSSKMEDDPASAEPGDGDLNKLEKALIEKKLTYRIFTSNVAIRGAKWSRGQKN